MLNALQQQRLSTEGPQSPSKKFSKMGGEVYVEAEAVKESDANVDL
jgi:hypothetical protein